jgi:short-subunit dehydrogenase
MRTALVTGASSGIGRAMSFLFAKDGIGLVITARNENALMDLQKEINSQYPAVPVTIISCDLSETGAAQVLYNNIQSMGISIDYLINNAGFGDTGWFVQTQWSKNEQMIQLNITTLTALCQLFVPGMKQRQFGRVLNVASTAAFQPGPTMAVYFATKSYVLHFSEAINSELKGTGVSVTALCPGPTETNFANAAGFKDGGLFDSKKKFPTAEEVAAFGYRALMQQQSVAIHGIMNYVMANSGRFFPRNWVVAITKWMMTK